MKRTASRTLTAAGLVAALAAAPGCVSDPQDVVQAGVMGANAEVGDIRLLSVYVEAPTAPAYPAGADARVWLTLLNQGTTPDALTGVTTPAADRVEIRWDQNCDGVYQAVPQLALQPTQPPRASTTGVPPFDAYHLRVVGFQDPVLAGSAIELTFAFQKAGTVTVEVLVQPSDAPRAEPSVRCAG
ncbi:copper chaperone PCu(A)C [Micromonospora sp. CPCC 206061]|uniref:copper chaperone PCu(A)C n=1 Tax=Micromonospora sp. CPCC 206061 TaxID=3122410 RepID=UPI002FEF3105